MSRAIYVEETSKLTFASDSSFLDLQKTSDGRPYGPIRYRQIVKELVLLADNHIDTYSNLLDITPTEKDLLIDYIIEKNQKSQKAMEEVRQKNQQRKNNRR